MDDKGRAAPPPAIGDTSPADWCGRIPAAAAGGGDAEDVQGVAGQPRSVITARRMRRQ